jgi:hypothetical protein
MSVLRQFLFLDTELVRQFLAQLEGGSYEEEAQRIRDSRGKEAAGELGASGLGARAGIRAGRTSGQEEEVERTVQQTPEAAYARLYERLQEQQAIQWLEAFDAAIWDQLRRGEVIEVEVVVAVSTFARYAQLGEQMGPLMEVMQAIGEPVDDETKTALAMFGNLGQMLGSATPFVARVPGAPEFKFVGSVTAPGLRVELDQLDGEATIAAKIQRKLTADERYTILDFIPGIRGLAAHDRAEMEKELTNSPEMPDMVIDGPLAVVTPIAIYR